MKKKGIYHYMNIIPLTMCFDVRQDIRYYLRRKKKQQEKKTNGEPNFRHMRTGTSIKKKYGIILHYIIYSQSHNAVKKNQR